MEKFKKELIGKKKILDIATGSGGFVHLITSEYDDFTTITGIDNNTKSIEMAKRYFADNRVNFENMDATSLDFAKGHFDVVSLSNSLHHFHDIGKVINEMERVLKPGGILVFNEMYKDNQDEKQMTHVLMHHFWSDIDTKLGLAHNETFKRQEILDLVSKTSNCTYVNDWDVTLPPHEMSNQKLTYLKNTIDKYLMKLVAFEDTEAFLNQADTIKSRIDEVGFKSATQCMLIYKK